jgi:predicted PurR-regulated permease PerM
VSQSQDLWTQLQQQVSHLRAQYGDTPWGHAIFARLSPSGAVQSHIAVYAGSVATSTLGGLATTFVLIATALYFAISPGLYIDGLVRLFPLPYRPRARDVLLDIGETLQWWSLGQLIDMSVVGVLTGIGLFILGVPLALALAVLAGLFTFVPYFGAIIAAVPAMLVALTVSWQDSLWVLAIFLGCHSIEGYVVSPLVQRRTVDLPPAASILSMTILGTIFGPLGVILGTPFAAALLVTVREVYVADVLGDSQTARVGNQPSRPAPAAIGSELQKG